MADLERVRELLCRLDAREAAEEITHRDLVEISQDIIAGLAPEERAQIEGASRSRHQSENQPEGPPDPLASPDAGDVWVDSTLGMRFRYCPPGFFWMGSPDDEPQRDVEEFFHKVRLTRGIWVAETPVTRGQYRALTDQDPSHFDGADDLPVEHLSWFDAVRFVNLMSERAGLEMCYRISGFEEVVTEYTDLDTWFRASSYEPKVELLGLGRTGFRLPTEAEWEYAARAGLSTPFSTGAKLTTDQANYCGENRFAGLPEGELRCEAVPVRSFPANQWGLYEVHGNVEEWVWDWLGEMEEWLWGWYETYGLGSVIDPTGPSAGWRRCARGGSWRSEAASCRFASRYCTQNWRVKEAGFRVVRADNPAMPVSHCRPAAAIVVTDREAGDLWVDSVLGMRFRYCPPGLFWMGSPDDELERRDDEVLHQVRLTRGIWVAETPVTQGEYRALSDRSASHFDGVDALPVTDVSWFDAVQFANLLSVQAGLEPCYRIKKFGCELKAELLSLDRTGFRLSTEAEWEYAARAGTSTPFWTGYNLSSDQANFNWHRRQMSRPRGKQRYRTEGNLGQNGQCGRRVLPVRSFPANPWGLFEVHGNVEEWVWDCCWSRDLGRDLPRTVVTDPIGQREPYLWEDSEDETRGYPDYPDDPWLPLAPCSKRVVRGGSWESVAAGCRSAYRGLFTPTTSSPRIGFRLVRTATD